MDVIQSGLPSSEGRGAEGKVDQESEVLVAGFLRTVISIEVSKAAACWGH